jgi:hypothetical protein
MIFLTARGKRRDFKMKEATIYSVVNEAYVSLATVWLKSLLDPSKSGEKIKKIFIADVGMSKESKKFIASLSDKIEILSTTTHSMPRRIHDNDWKNAVAEKTRKLLTLCEEDNYPIIMMDADQYIVQDFTDELYDGCDFQPCKILPEDMPGNEDGYELAYIGSWFVIHNDSGKDFLKQWIEKMWNTTGRHVETPSLVLTIKDLQNNNMHCNFIANEERVVSAPKYYDKSKILHFRSSGQQPVDFLRRIGNLKNMPMHVLEDIFTTLRENDGWKEKNK